MIDLINTSPRPTSRSDTPHIVLAGDDGPVSLGDPAWTLRARGADALRILPDRVQEALAGDCVFACGLIPYDAGLSLHGIPGVDGQAVVHLFREPPRPYRPASDRHFELTGPFQAEQTPAFYRRALARILDYLAAGDVYQVNYAQRFQARWAGDVLAGFDRLLAAHPAPHAGFSAMATRRSSASPGALPEHRQRRGTHRAHQGLPAPGANEEEDKALGEALRRHPKDRAENLMIVDLLRNDLGEFCQAGSIRVDPLFELRRFSNVQHLVSTITGTLRPGVAPWPPCSAPSPAAASPAPPRNGPWKSSRNWSRHPRRLLRQPVLAGPARPLRQQHPDPHPADRRRPPVLPRRRRHRLRLRPGRRIRGKLVQGEETYGIN